MSLLKTFKTRPVMASLYGIEQIPAFLRSICEVAIVANIPLRKLADVVDTLVTADKSVVVNIDSCEGLSPDKAAIEFLEDLGATGIVSTRVPTMQKTVQSKMIAVQKVFVTDRSTLPRSLRAIAQSGADFVQIMPSPMVGYLKDQEIKTMPPIIASGFICEENDIKQVLNLGAVAVSSSASKLWNYQTK